MNTCGNQLKLITLQLFLLLYLNSHFSKLIHETSLSDRTPFTLIKGFLDYFYPQGTEFVDMQAPHAKERKQAKKKSK